MNKFIRIAALGLAIGMVGAVMSGCGSDKYAEQYDVLSESSKKTLAIKNGSLVIDENITIPKDIEGVLESGASYTQITYTNDGKLEYHLTKYDSADKDRSEPYEILTTAKGVFESRGDERPTEYKGEAPKVLEYLMLDFKLEDVKKIDVEIRSTDTLYTVTTNAAYADKFDTEINGGEYDCTAVEYVYSIDRLNKIKSVNTEYTADFTYKGETQETVKNVKVGFTENVENPNAPDNSAVKLESYNAIISSIEAVLKSESAKLTVEEKTTVVDNVIPGIAENSTLTKTVERGDADFEAYVALERDYSEISVIDILRIPAGAETGYKQTRYIVAIYPDYSAEKNHEIEGGKYECSRIYYTYLIDVEDGLIEVTETTEGEYTLGETVSKATETVTVSIG